MNLHHTLYNQSAGKNAGRRPDLPALTPAEAAAWNEAMDYYDRDRSGAPAPVIVILEKAAPVYRAHWWPDHDRKNHEWIELASPLIARYENPLKPALSHAYNTPWPKQRIRVEMSYYTTGNAAYTSVYPTLITISSWSRRNEGPAAVETLFHEAGHALIDRARREIARAEQQSGRKLAHQDLWHALIFYNSGELVRRQLPTLLPYAERYGLWDKSWPDVRPVLEKEWKPFLEGNGTFRDATAWIVANLH